MKAGMEGREMTGGDRGAGPWATERGKRAPWRGWGARTGGEWGMEAMGDVLIVR